MPARLRAGRCQLQRSAPRSGRASHRVHLTCPAVMPPSRSMIGRIFRRRLVGLGVIAILVAGTLVAADVPAAANSTALIGACGVQTNPHEGQIKDSSRGMVKGALANVTVRSSNP